MDIQDVLHTFNHPPVGCFPSEAVNAALEQQEAITPHLLTILERTVSNYQSIELDRMDHVFALYLLSKFREKKALPHILALAALPGQWPEDLLGDCITEGLSRFIVSTFNEDLSLIKQVIEDETLNEWSRNAALNSLLGLVAIQKLQREDVIEYLRTLFHSPLVEDEGFATHLVRAASDLYPEELLQEINQLFEQDKVNQWVIVREVIEDILEEGKEQCLKEYVYEYLHHLPIDDVDKAMSWMAVFHTEQELEDECFEYEEDLDDDWNWNTGWNDESDLAVTTYVRPTPKIGRNAPCSCGSKKKFKKCCGVL